MRRISSFDTSVVLVASMMLASAPAYAQATRTWVSGVGDDINPCSRTAPCKTFAGAIANTAPGGEINCIDPGGFAAVTITKSITIDCQTTPAFILATGSNGININAGATDSIVLRGLSINGTGTPPGGRGVNIVAAQSVIIESLRIMNFSQQGIADLRSTPGNVTLSIIDTTARYTSAGLGIATSGNTLNVLIDNFRSLNNGFGIALSTGTKALIRNSDLSHNTTAGIDNEGATIVATNNAITSNGTGVRNDSGITRLKNNDITFSTTAGINNISGFVVTYGENRNDGSTIGTITPAGSPSTNLGEQ